MFKTMQSLTVLTLTATYKSSPQECLLDLLSPEEASALGTDIYSAHCDRQAFRM